MFHQKKQAMNHLSQQECLNLLIKNTPYCYDERFPLLSIHLTSNRPDQFTEFVNNIHSSCHHKNAYEIIVKIDTEDTTMIACVSALSKQYGKDKVKAFIGAKKLGPWSAWEFFNDMFHLTHPNTYFLWNPSDEVRINTPEWDNILANYIGFYPDHVFRLKLSDNRLRNFYKMADVLRDPDNFPFMTKKWIDICGVWGDCHSPDVFHQAVSFYLGKQNIFRDVPIFDIQLSGIEAGLLIPSSQKTNRVLNVRRLWLIALSKEMRSRYIAHANKLRFYIQSVQREATEITIHDHTNYPSIVECSNNVYMHETIKCRDRSILTYALKLRNEYIQPKIKFLKSIFITKPLKIMFFNPIMSLIFIVSLVILLKHNISVAAKITSLLLLSTSAWRLGFSYKREWSILKSRLRF